MKIEVWSMESEKKIESFKSYKKFQEWVIWNFQEFVLSYSGPHGTSDKVSAEFIAGKPKKGISKFVFKKRGVGNVKYGVLKYL